MQNDQTMDVTGSLRKVARELLELNLENFSYAEQQQRLEAASWLITYIADALDVELQMAAARGRALALKQLEQPPGPNGVRDFRIIQGEDI